jgi:flagellum-specific peptidoglycan hydrolase FlgJ
MGRHKDTDWGVIATIAKEKGAKYHDLVAAQWALESGWGSKLTGRNNVFGLKGTGAANSSLTATHEEEGGVMVPQKAWFLDFDSIEACIAYLVDRWYKDFRGHQGVNRASDRNAAAHMLQSEGYATDSRYAAKLITLMDKHAPAAAPAAPQARAAGDRCFPSGRGRP